MVWCCGRELLVLDLFIIAEGMLKRHTWTKNVSNSSSSKTVCKSQLMRHFEREKKEDLNETLGVWDDGKIWTHLCKCHILGKEIIWCFVCKHLCRSVFTHTHTHSSDVPICFVSRPANGPNLDQKQMILGKLINNVLPDMHNIFRAFGLEAKWWFCRIHSIALWNYSFTTIVVRFLELKSAIKTIMKETQNNQAQTWQCEKQCFCCCNLITWNGML